MAQQVKDPGVVSVSRWVQSLVCVGVFWPRWIPEQMVMGQLLGLIMVWCTILF